MMTTPRIAQTIEIRYRPAINWLGFACRSLQASVPEASGDAQYLVERLSLLLLARLPADLAEELLDLLPDPEARPRSQGLTPVEKKAGKGERGPKRAGAGERPLRRGASRMKGAGKSGDRSIGLTDFVELTRRLLGVTDIPRQPKYEGSEPEYCKLCEQVTDAFLWAVSQEIPVELKGRMAEHLPADLRCRMNLRSGYSARDKVA
jgi:hypothetical protein